MCEAFRIFCRSQRGFRCHGLLRPIGRPAGFSCHGGTPGAGRRSGSVCRRSVASASRDGADSRHRFLPALHPSHGAMCEDGADSFQAVRAGRLRREGGHDRGLGSSLAEIARASLGGRSGQKEGEKTKQLQRAATICRRLALARAKAEARATPAAKARAKVNERARRQARRNAAPGRIFPAILLPQRPEHDEISSDTSTEPDNSSPGSEPESTSRV